MFDIRVATTSDTDAIAGLVDEAYGHYVERIGRKPLPMIVNYQTAIEEHQIWVIEAAVHLKAVLELIPSNTYLLIENIAIAPDYQKQGIGRWLMFFAEREAIRQGFAEIRLYTNERFVENLAFYAKLGYTEMYREDFKGLDVVHFHKVLVDID